mmetsp:Transcript_74014/g.130759  ORF Transcript_74014/g.130759 Transcript_74014/m.130759 type:complete len:286 (+) Transcript_74014:42-899(+)
MGNSKSICKIDEGLFICGVGALGDFDRLRSFGIKCILNAARDDLYRISGVGATDLTALPDHFEVKIIGADDVDDCNLSVHFFEIADFIEYGRRKGGVVVHCAAGISRATTSCTSYLMLKEHWTLEAAFRKIHSVRNIVSPNPGFWRQLCDLQASLQAQGIVLRSLPEDWKPQPQPLKPDEADGKMSASWEETCQVLASLNEQAQTVMPFVTQFLTARLLPNTGKSVASLQKEVEASSLPGVTWSGSSCSDKELMIRVGCVPTLDANSLANLLSALPGVESVNCEQ